MHTISNYIINNVLISTLTIIYITLNNKVSLVSCEHIPIIFPDSLPKAEDANNGRRAYNPQQDEEMSSNEMHDMALAMNHMKNMSDFIFFYGLDNSITKSEIDISTESSKFESIMGADEDEFLDAPPRFGAPSETGEPQIFNQASCEPELTSVSLDLPRRHGLTYFPTCVRVPQCGHCGCFSKHQTCQPSKRDYAKVRVLQTDRSTPSFRRRRRRQAAHVQFLVVPVDRHLECSCQCRLKVTDCDPELHWFNQHFCRCLCVNESEQRSCMKRETHFWDSEKCKCRCKIRRTCSSGYTFSHDTCRCEAINYIDFF